MLSQPADRQAQSKHLPSNFYELILVPIDIGIRIKKEKANIILLIPPPS